MAVRRLPDIQSKLIENGRSPNTPVAIIESGTSDDQRVVHGCLGDLADLGERQHIVAPATLFVGAVAGFGVGREWFEGRSELQDCQTLVPVAGF
jgi:siroheme synthase